MLTPTEIHKITFKTGRGYKKDDVDSFMLALYHDYEIMYKENKEIKEKVDTLSDGLQYYKNLEKTLQKSLILAEKTSEETKEAAQKQAAVIEQQAKLNADMILADAKKDLFMIETKIKELLQNYEVYKSQMKQIAKSQLEVIDSGAFDITVKKHDLKFYKDEQKVKSDEEVFKEPDFEEALKLDKTYVKSDALEKEEEINLARAVEEKESNSIETGKDTFADLKTEVKEEPHRAIEEAKAEADKVEQEMKKAAEDIKKEEDSLPKIDLEAAINAAPVVAHSMDEDEVSVKKSHIPVMDRSREKAEYESVYAAKEPEKEEATGKEEIPVEKPVSKAVSKEEQTEDDIEIKMLQKLLNDIKRKTEADSGEEAFEFISSDGEE